MGLLGKVIGTVIAGAVVEDVIDDINEKGKEWKEEKEYFYDDDVKSAKSGKTSLINLTCQGCGQGLEMDMDKLMAYCPYCGTKLMIAIDDLDNVIAAKEKTKRLQMKYDHEMAMEKERQAEEKHNDKILIIMLAICFAVCGIMALFE